MPASRHRRATASTSSTWTYRTDVEGTWALIERGEGLQPSKDRELSHPLGAEVVEGNHIADRLLQFRRRSSAERKPEQGVYDRATAREGGQDMWRQAAGRGVVRFAAQGLIVAALVLGGTSPAFAAKPTGRGGGGGGGGMSTPTGNDVSYPQCASSLPAGPAFGIVGVTGGLANDLNPCFGPSTSYPRYTQSELYWAVASSVGGTSQPKASLYVNTGDPGNVYNGQVIGDWPSSGSTPDGSCTTTTVTLTGGTFIVGANSDACAWQYGYDRGTQDASWLGTAATAIDNQAPPVTVAGAAASYPWWLDVETGNTWQSDTTVNVADLQGMIAGLKAAGATTIGAYSTASQWNTITGGTSSASGSLYQIPNWIPGARNLSGAQANCAQNSFTGGVVTLTQWFGRPDDGDYAC